MDMALRMVVVGVVLVLLARSARLAWRNRTMVVAVWRRLRLRHLVGSLGVLALLLTVLVALLAWVPGADWGVGRLIGLHGNAVFAPLEEATARGAATGAANPPWWLVVGVTGFLVGLLALLPWLAYVEERVFREGLEDAGLGRELWTALRFGLLHLVMLIPIGAALAIGVAGFVYGRLYRRAFARARARTHPQAGPFGVPVLVGPSVRQARAEAVMVSTVWHTCVNSLIVSLLLAGFLVEWLR